MADIQEPVTKPAEAAPAVPAADPTPPAAPAAEPAAPAATEAAPVEKPAEPAATETPVPPAAESVLGAEKPVETKPTETVEKKPDATEGEKPKDAPAEPVKVELPKYEEFKIPEGVSVEKEPMEAFSKILGEIETGKLDHVGMQTKGQELIDLAAKNTIDSIERLNDYYVQIHNEQKANWFKDFKADPVMGGGNVEATMSLLQTSVSEYGGTTEQIASLRKMVNDTGVTNNPDLLRLIYNMQQKINTYTTEGGENRIVPGAKPAPSKTRDYQRFYTGSAS